MKKIEAPRELSPRGEAFIILTVNHLARTLAYWISPRSEKQSRETRSGVIGRVFFKSIENVADN